MLGRNEPMKDLGWKLFFALFGVLQVLAVILLTMILSRLERVETTVGEHGSRQSLIEYRVEQIEQKAVQTTR